MRWSQTVVVFVAVGHVYSSITVYIRVYMYICIHTYSNMCISIYDGDALEVKSSGTTRWCRVIGCLVFIGHFLQKSPIISGSFANK